MKVPLLLGDDNYNGNIKIESTVTAQYKYLIPMYLCTMSDRKNNDVRVIKQLCANYKVYFLFLQMIRYPSKNFCDYIKL